jgi:DNA-binding FrmR family transcriptional regulator
MMPSESSDLDPTHHVAAHARRQADVDQRLRSIEGHIRGIRKMVLDDAYCIDIMKQVKAVKQALERVSSITLETHLETCVTDGLRSDDPRDRERVIFEIVEVFNATGKL